MTILSALGSVDLGQIAHDDLGQLLFGLLFFVLAVLQGLTLFVLAGIRSDIRDVRQTAKDDREQVAKQEQQRDKELRDRDREVADLRETVSLLRQNCDHHHQRASDPAWFDASALRKNGGKRRSEE